MSPDMSDYTYESMRPEEVLQPTCGLEHFSSCFVGKYSREQAKVSGTLDMLLSRHIRRQTIYDTRQAGVSRILLDPAFHWPVVDIHFSILLRWRKAPCMLYSRAKTSTCFNPETRVCRGLLSNVGANCSTLYPISRPDLAHHPTIKCSHQPEISLYRSCMA